MRVSIDRETGDYETFRRWHRRARRGARGAGAPDSPSLTPRQRADPPTSRSTTYIEEPLEPVEFGRIGAQAAKQVILQKIRDAEREQILNDFLDAAGDLRTGTVKRIERGNAIVESGRIEARAAARPDDPEGESARRRPRPRLR